MVTQEDIQVTAEQLRNQDLASWLRKRKTRHLILFRIVCRFSEHSRRDGDSVHISESRIISALPTDLRDKLRNLADPRWNGSFISGPARSMLHGLCSKKLLVSQEEITECSKKKKKVMIVSYTPTRFGMAMYNVLDKNGNLVNPESLNQIDVSKYCQHYPDGNESNFLPSRERTNHDGFSELIVTDDEYDAAHKKNSSNGNLPLACVRPVDAEDIRFPGSIVHRDTSPELCDPIPGVDQDKIHFQAIEENVVKFFRTLEKTVFDLRQELAQSKRDAVEERIRFEQSKEADAEEIRVTKSDLDELRCKFEVEKNDALEARNRFEQKKQQDAEEIRVFKCDLDDLKRRIEVVKNVYLDNQ